MTAVPTRDEGREETRRKMIGAARRAFCAQPFDEVSVQEIIAEAGVARGTFYNHFADKAACYHAVMDDSTEVLRSAMREARRAAPDAVAFLAHMFAAGVKAEIEQARTVRMAVNAPHLIREPQQTALRWFVDDLAEDLEDGISRGVLRPHDPRMVGAAIIGAIYTGGYHLRRDGPEAAPALAAYGEFLMKVFLPQIAPEGS